MFYNTTFPACYVLPKLKIPWKHALINVKFSPLFTGYTYVCVAALESHENQCQTQPYHHAVQRQRRPQSFTNGRRTRYVTSVRRPYARPDPTRPDPTRPNPTRPDPITLLRSLYLWNGLTDSRAVFFVRCHHSINFIFDRYRYPPVPATARGTFRGEGVEDNLSLGNSTTAGPIAFKFGV